MKDLEFVQNNRVRRWTLTAAFGVAAFLLGNFLHPVELHQPVARATVESMDLSSTSTQPFIDSICTGVFKKRLERIAAIPTPGVIAPPGSAEILAMSQGIHDRVMRTTLAAGGLAKQVDIFCALVNVSTP